MILRRHVHDSADTFVPPVRRDPPPQTVAAIDRELREIVCAGAALVPVVDHLVQRCKDEAATAGSDLARAGGGVVIEYLHLRQRLERLPQTPHVRHLDELLNFEQTLLHQALLYAFRPASIDKWRLVADLGGGRGAPSDELERLAADYG